MKLAIMHGANMRVDGADGLINIAQMLELRTAREEPFRGISSDRQARPLADGNDRTRGTRMFECQSPTD